MSLHFSRSIFLGMTSLFLLGFLGFTSSYAADNAAESRSDQLIKQMKRQNALLKVEFDKKKAEMDEQLKMKEADIQALETSLAEEVAKNKSLQAQLNKEKREKAALEDTLVKTQTTLQNTEKNLSEMIANYNQAQEDLSVNDKQRKTQLANLAETNKALLDSKTKNEKLYTYALELIKVYDDPNAFERMMRNENFTRIKHVELENILQNYNDKIDAERISVGKQ